MQEYVTDLFISYAMMSNVMLNKSVENQRPCSLSVLMRKVFGPSP